MKTKYFVYIFLCVLIVSCQNRKKKVYQVPDEIQPIVSTFIIEAYKRGHRLVIDDLIITYKYNIITSGVHAAGLCRTRFGHTPIIYIDTTTLNWRNSEMSREQLIFHELGHCILGRSHTRDTLQNGQPASLMRPTGETLYGSIMSQYKRDYYLDELFNPLIDKPSWAQVTEMYEDPFTTLDTVFYESFQVDSIYELYESDSLLMVDSLFIEKWSLGENSVSRRSIKDGQLEIESFKLGTYFVPFSTELDTQSNFEIRFTSTIHSASKGSASFYWGGENVRDVFALVINKSGYVSIGQVDKGVVAAKYDVPVFLNARNEVLIRKVGGYYYFYINGYFIDKLSFVPFRGNLFGFGVSGQLSKLSIDNILVTMIE